MGNLSALDEINIDQGFGAYAIHQQGMAIYPNHGKNQLYPILGLIGEIGELYQKIKKNIRDGDGELDRELKAALQKEVGDVMWYLSAFCDEWDLNFAEAAVGNLKKLYSRIERGTIHGSGDSR